MKQLKCPLDGIPCQKDCPDRYKDRPEGGCDLTTAEEQGGKIIGIWGNNAAIMFFPDGGVSE